MRNEDTGNKGDTMPESIQRPVLSISLLCSGRNINEAIKCLDSLMTIRKRVSSEIVIVDTGCNAEARTLIEKYADLIVDFTWCNDFAKARNAGLEKCIGEWFMFVDDDEWFESTDTIVDFFNSGEYRGYGRAQYIIRNYTNSEGTEYNDAWNERLEKRSPGMEFKGKVHEYLEPKEGEIKFLDDYVHHYGYVFTDRALMYKKERRNIPLLLDMIKEEPYNPHWYAQLIQEYRNLGEYSAMKQICDQAMDMVKDIDTPVVNSHRPDFYEGILISEIHTYQFDKAISDVNEFLADDRNSEKCNIGLYFYAVQAYWESKDYQNTFIFSGKYLDGYEKYSQIEDISVNDFTFMCGNIFDRDRMLYCISRIIASGVRCGNISALHDYFDRFDLTYQKEPLIPFCEGVTYAITHFDFDDRFVGYAEKMCEHPYMLALLINEAKDTEKNSSRQFRRLVEVYGRLRRADDPYLVYMRIRLAMQHNDGDELRRQYLSYFTYIVDSFDANDKIWQIADDTGLNLISVFREIPFNRWKQDVDLFFKKNSEDGIEKIQKLLDLIGNNADIRFDYYRLKIKELNTSRTDTGSVDAMLNDYCSSCINFYLRIYNPKVFTGDTTVLPDDCRFAMEFVKTVSSEALFKPVDFIHELELCAGIYSGFSESMKKYISNYGDRKRAELMKQL